MNTGKHKILHPLTIRSFLEKGTRLLLIVTIACLFIPLNPAMPLEGLDNSWMFGMNQAIAQHLAFGRDIIFTFGPYASVYTKEYHPATDFLMLLGGTFLALSYSVGILFLISKERWCLGLGYAALLAGVMYSPDALIFSYALIVAASAYKAITLKQTHQSTSKSITLIMIVLFFCLGLPPLIKGSMLILCGAISVLCFLLFALKKEKTLAIIALALPTCSMIGFWLVSGQSVLDLPTYVSNMAPIASGYTDAMSIVGDTSEVWTYLIASVVLCLGLVANKRNFSVENIFLWCVFPVFLFLAFKGGFVRHDGHAMMAAIALAIAALIYFAITTNKNNLPVVVFCFCAGFYICNHYHPISTATFKYNALRTYILAIDGLTNRLQDRNWLDQQFSAAIKKLKEKSNFPIMQGTTDIYSYNQSNLIASGNNWNPRPILQSYSVYTESLAIKNRDHLLGKSAPDNIVFSVEPIDSRLPPLEDGASWPALLSQYHPITSQDNRIFLAKNIPATNYVAPTLILSATHSLGEDVSVPETSNPVFVELDIKPTLMGRIANILFKPAKLKIKITLITGSSKEYRLISGFSKSGFIISPLVEYTPEFSLLYANKSFLQNKMVKSFSVTTEDGSSIFWQNEFSIKFKNLELPPPMDISKAYKFDTINDAKSDYQIASDGYCSGGIDIINGLPAAKTITASGLLSVDGWLATPTDDGLRPATAFVALRNKNGQLRLIETRVVERPDIAAGFNTPALNNAGYTSVADISGLDGKYTLSLAFKHSDQVKICPQLQNIVMINNR